MDDADPVPPRRTRIKFCGLTREADVDAAVDAGADAVGFVLWPTSARAVDAARAGALAARLPPFVQPVLLFVNPTADALRAGFDAVPHAIAQFHGDESPEDCARLARAGLGDGAASRRWLRAARMAPGVALLDFAERFAARPGFAGLVLDAHVDGYGGAGEVFDWSLVPRGVACPVVLAGGLNASNVTDGIARLAPWAVDVSSGVESSKGIKDARAMRAFAAAVRSADARHLRPDASS